ncbi:lipoyl(octanoyl) transferase LipB [Sanguibacter antarcticus]|uniref:Octanoyltransferase n=1 Tax=Sanguibacter antarcticus TaxID=372484 RepID=A0A2A9E217_9MICO|nr:lipoyl(octanoyl) transferase LipB [Sanguibacter antarcticus]PFG32883.1 lipoyl(octanoyl) transferase [Sanguibacter antarcticus]
MEILSLGLGESLADYETTWALQREIHGEVADGTRPDTVLLVEHSSVYTAGRRTRIAERPADGIPVIDVDRGGKITWHGPGQLVAYPIVRLAEPIDVVEYVRALEQAVVDLCADLGLATVRVDGRSGVWFPATPSRLERKVCAIGVRVARGVTMHGLALNCDPDLGAFGTIVPCGISDADVTSLSDELGRPFGPLDAEPLLRHHLAARLPALSQTSRLITADSTGTATSLT